MGDQKLDCSDSKCFAVFFTSSRRSKQATTTRNQGAGDRIRTSKMENCDVAPINLRAIKLGPTINESDVDGMTVGPD